MGVDAPQSPEHYMPASSLIACVDKTLQELEVMSGSNNHFSVGSIIYLQLLFQYHVSSWQFYPKCFMLHITS